MKMRMHNVGTGLIMVAINGRVYNVNKEHKNYHSVLKAFNDGDDELFVKAYNMEWNAKEKMVEKFVEDFGLVFDNGVCTYHGHQIENWIVDQIVGRSVAQYNIEHLKLFLSNMLKNPSGAVFKELPKFMQHGKIEITEDGCLLAYKAVTSDYWDKHTGKTYQFKPGAEIEMPRCFVDENTRLACSSGIHVGTFQYSSPEQGWFFKHSEGDRCVVVKVNPADVVCVPENEPTKMRVCKLVVVGEYTGALTRDDESIEKVDLEEMIVEENSTLSEKDIVPGVSISFVYRGHDVVGTVHSVRDRIVELKSGKKYHLNFVEKDSIRLV